MKLTRDGICYNLEKTPYKVNVDYKDKTLTFMFSSKIYKNKFLNKLKENRKTINESLTKRFKFEIIADLIADIKLYSSIETRGFLIISNGVLIECLENVLLNGETVTKKN